MARRAVKRRPQQVQVAELLRWKVAQARYLWWAEAQTNYPRLESNSSLCLCPKEEALRRCQCWMILNRTVPARPWLWWAET